MLWCSLVLFPQLAVAFSWASLFGSQGVAADQYVIQPPSQPRIAIVGAGAAGSSAAFWISKAVERLGKDITVDVFERADYIGGRSTVVYPYNDTTLKPAELGASIFVDANKNLVRAAKEFNLEVISFEDGDAQLGVWDGSQILVTMGESTFFGKIWENIKLLWRYGYRSPVTTTALVKQMIDTYLSLYKTTIHWDSVEAVSSALNFTDIVAQDTATYLASQGVGDAFAYEVVEASTRVNYGQNLDKIHALEGMCSMAANGAKGIKKGNYNMFKRFLKLSKANVHLNTLVSGIYYTPEGRWALRTKGNSGSAEEVALTETYDSVILAAPYHTLTMDMPSSVAPVVPVEYVHLHVTLLSTTSPSANPEYFGLSPGESVPSMMLTTAQGIRAGGPAPEFNSMSYHGRIAEGRDEWVVKIFSEQRITDEWLANVFSNVGWVHRKEWDAYPKLPPTTQYSPIKLDNGLYYVNGFESFISTMETETIASRGVVDLVLRDMFNEGICPSGVSLPPPEGVEFVWGWDC